MKNWGTNVIHVTTFCYFIYVTILFFQCSAVDNLGKDRLSSSNLISGRAISDKLPKCIFENIKVATVKQGPFQNFQKPCGWFIPKISRTKHVMTF